MQARLLKVLDDMDPVDLSHIMWALFNYNNNPEPAALDAFLAVLPSQLDNTEPAVSYLWHIWSELVSLRF